MNVSHPDHQCRTTGRYRSPWPTADRPSDKKTWARRVMVASSPRPGTRRSAPRPSTRGRQPRVGAPASRVRPVAPPPALRCSRDPRRLHGVRPRARPDGPGTHPTGEAVCGGEYPHRSARDAVAHAGSNSTLLSPRKPTTASFTDNHLRPSSPRRRRRLVASLTTSATVPGARPPQASQRPRSDLGRAQIAAQIPLAGVVSLHLSR